MNDDKAALAAAVAGGYLLGRTKKAKLAFAVGSYLVGRRVGLSPAQVLSQGLGGLQQNPAVQELTDRVRDELVTAGRAAVGAAANRRLTGLADLLRDRTDALAAENGRGDARDEDDEDDDDRAPDEDDYFDEEDEEEDREPAPAPRKRTAEKVPPRKAPPRKAAPPAKKAAKKTAKKAPAKQAPGSGGRSGGARR